MDTTMVTLYNSETDTLYELQLSTEDAVRVQNDVVFATSLMTAAMQEQQQEQQQEQLQTTSVNDDISAENTADEEFLEELPVTRTKEKEKEDAKGEEETLYRWNTPCVFLLLETYQLVEHKLTSGKQSQKRTWQEVSDVLKQKGYSVTGMQCSSKMRSLKKTYKSIKDHNNQSGNDRRTWQFYEVMDSIFSKKAWCEPVALASSSGFTANKNGGGSEGSDSSGCRSVPSRQKLSATSLLQKRLMQKEEHEAAKAERHKQKMAMDEKLITAIEKLINK